MGVLILDPAIHIYWQEEGRSGRKQGGRQEGRKEKRNAEKLKKL